MTAEIIGDCFSPFQGCVSRRPRRRWQPAKLTPVSAPRIIARVRYLLFSRMGRREIPFVTKLDRHDRIAKERVAVEGVENLLGANAPRLADYVDLETRGAIKYHFATMYAGEVRTLQRAFREADGPGAARALLDRVIDRLLRRLYQSPQLDRLDLFAYYRFEPRYAEATLARVAELGEAARAHARQLTLPWLTSGTARGRTPPRSRPTAVKARGSQAPRVRGRRAPASADRASARR